uniref:NAC domain-containing protein n=1 Tax=Steinernema glaseri TaxID=37863 RepID=A0A1I7Y603_9BILA
MCSLLLHFFPFNTLIYWYYYNTKILLPVSGRRLVYRFGPNAQGWREGGLLAGLNDGGGSLRSHQDFHGHAGPTYPPQLVHTGGNYLHCAELCVGAYDDSGEEEFLDDEEEPDAAFMPRIVPANLHSTALAAAFDHS